jgi:DeoR family glycerol-3-phosphate regulon repressor
MDYDPDEAAFARAVLASGRRRIVVCDSGKFGRRALVEVCPLGGIDALVTEVAPTGTLAAALAEHDVAVTLSEAGPAAAE